MWHSYRMSFSPTLLETHTHRCCMAVLDCHLPSACSQREGRRGLPERAGAIPVPHALPSRRPPWRGPLGTKGETLQTQTSWLAPDTGEGETVSISSQPSLPVRSQGNHCPNYCLREAEEVLFDSCGHPGVCCEVSPPSTLWFPPP